MKGRHTVCQLQNYQLTDHALLGTSVCLCVWLLMLCSKLCSVLCALYTWAISACSCRSSCHICWAFAAVSCQNAESVREKRANDMLQIDCIRSHYGNPTPCTGNRVTSGSKEAIWRVQKIAVVSVAILMTAVLLLLLLLCNLNALSEFSSERWQAHCKCWDKAIFQNVERVECEFDRHCNLLLHNGSHKS